ncbi:Phospholipid hydroperoxide glutathione peroxidase, mitochondrial, partial [Halocaridina rubra]
EPGSEAEIKKFAEGFGVKFDMFSKIKVNGDDAHPLFNYLKSKQGGTLGNFIKWNFTKFLVDKEGTPVARYSPQTNPIRLRADARTDGQPALPAKSSQLRA